MYHILVVIRNRLIALLGRITILVGLFVVAYFYLLNGPAWAYLLQFETECAIIYMVILTFVIIFNAIDLRRGIHGIAAGPVMPISLMIVSFCFISNIGYFVYTLPAGAAPSSLDSIIFHAFFLALPVLEWLLFDIKGTVRWYSAFSAMIYPILYVIFCGFRSLIWPNAVLPNGSMYPYPYLEPAWGPFVGWAILTFLLVYGVNVLFIFLNNLLSGKYRFGNEINPF